MKEENKHALLAWSGVIIGFLILWIASKVVK